MPTPKDYVERANRISAALAKHDAENKLVTPSLLMAGDEAVDALKELLEDRVFWTHLGTKKAPEDTSADPYAPVVTRYHAAVLTALGYKGPPPAPAVAQSIADLIVAKRGAEPKELAEVKGAVVKLKDDLVRLVGQARALKPVTVTADGPWLSEKLKSGIKLVNNIMLTGAALVGMFYGPLFPPPPPPPAPAPPPIVIVVPRDELPPGLRNPPPGTEDRGRIFFYRALPGPDEDAPKPPSQRRET